MNTSLTKIFVSFRRLSLKVKCIIVVDNHVTDVNIELLAGQLKKKAIKDDKNENKHEHKKKILSSADTDLVTPVLLQG